MEPGTVLLEFDGVAPGPLAFAAPRRVIAAAALADVRPALAAVEAEVAAGSWAAGYVAYEAAPALDAALGARPPGAGPLAWFGIYGGPAGGAPEPRGDAALGPLVPDVDRRGHAASVARIREAIARGDVYQVNHTFRLRGPFAGDPLALYRRLRAAQGGGLGAVVCTGDRAIVSASPELFLERRGALVRARPMKGTARRGRFPAEDDRAAAALAASEKDRAENVMIADLLRNDLGRVARTGTVRVASLFDVERWRTVLQLTSTVEAELRPRTSLEELFAAAFPCGSVTGAPKAAATRIIAAEERSPRGAYCGAIGWVAPGGGAAFNVAIRTVELDLARGEAVAGIGGGVTWGSTAHGELDEALAKAAFLTERVDPFELVETMRLEGGEYPLLARHLARLAGSARYFGFALDLPRVRHALAGEAARAAGEARRVRLRVAADGAARVESAPLPPASPEPLPVALAATRVSRHDRFLFHKTTRRDPYDRARAERPDVFDVLLANEEGELTEFCIGNLVLELDGERVTPPRDCGLLAGVFREGLVAAGEVRERPVRREELARATRAWLVNAVRGWVPVRPVHP
ncbi:MAG TPA: chorismate-binding protein [Anaeromyxobacter sp.]|nr:chorismate-binding protein [Anaeromyxobacter sp.]